jgi:hypothetical protein
MACAGGDTVPVIHSFKDGLPGVRAVHPEARLSLGSDPEVPGEAVMVVDYPAQNDDPAGRDVQCSAETRDWSDARGIAFQVKPSKAVRLSVSFLDRNGVVYTGWADLKEGIWQPVRFAFDELRPNPYFQPPGAKTGSPLDVSDVGFIAFAPQSKDPGRLAVGTFVLVK